MHGLTQGFCFVIALGKQKTNPAPITANLELLCSSWKWGTRPNGANQNMDLTPGCLLHPRSLWLSRYSQPPTTNLSSWIFPFLLLTLWTSSLSLCTADSILYPPPMLPSYIVSSFLLIPKTILFHSNYELSILTWTFFLVNFFGFGVKHVYSYILSNINLSLNTHHAFLLGSRLPHSGRYFHVPSICLQN